SAENGTKTEEQVQVYEIKKGDRILIRNAELIPVDAVLLKGNAQIDYSFVTGEAEPVEKRSGDKIYAGGRQQGGIIEIETLKPIEQSYLTQLWSDEVFSKEKRSRFQSLIDKISKSFTIVVLSIALLSTSFWLIYEPATALNVFTAILIIACPCAIALASPFTLGNLLRIFGRHKFYLKETGVIEQMAKIDAVVFDKTGTITSNARNNISYHGIALNREEEELLTSSLRASSHPLSRALYGILDKNNIRTLDEYEEHIGKGIEAKAHDRKIKIGSASFVREDRPAAAALAETANKTSVHISSNDEYRGCFVFQSTYREGVAELFSELGQDKQLFILSGDNDGEREKLQEILPEGTQLFFDQKPADKLKFIKDLQESGKNVMMIGDGLNDAGALAQSDVGIAVSENINIFSPACDGILDATKFQSLRQFLDLSALGMKVIKWSFLLSLLYNLAGLAFAVTGHLRPVVAAILMPLSSISIVLFTSLVTHFLGKRLTK
ncbi:MAG: HAD-IC family P-type ATPase, partial [Salegentibacter sp.]